MYLGGHEWRDVEGEFRAHAPPVVPPPTITGAGGYDDDDSDL